MLPYPVLRTHRRPASGSIAQPRPVTTMGAIGGGGGDKGLGEEGGGGECDGGEGDGGSGEGDGGGCEGDDGGSVEAGNGGDGGSGRRQDQLQLAGQRLS